MPPQLLSHEVLEPTWYGFFLQALKYTNYVNDKHVSHFLSRAVRSLKEDKPVVSEVSVPGHWHQGKKYGQYGTARESSSVPGRCKAEPRGGEQAQMYSPRPHPP